MSTTTVTFQQTEPEPPPIEGEFTITIEMLDIRDAEWAVTFLKETGMRACPTFLKQIRSLLEGQLSRNKRKHKGD